MISVAWRALCDAVSATGLAAAKNTNKPVLGCLLIQAGPNGGSVTGSNTELSIRADVPDLIASKPVEVLVPAAQLNQSLKAMQCDRIEIKSTASGVSVTNGSSTIKIPTQEPSEFPRPQWATGPGWDVPGDLLAKAMKDLPKCTDATSTRFALSAILFERSTKGLSLVATDGRQMCVAELPLVSANDSQSSFLLPGASAMAVARIAEGLLCTLRPNGNVIDITAGGYSLQSRLTEGKFPRWEELLRVGSDYVPITVPREKLLELLRQAAVLSQPESHGVDVSIDGTTLKVSRSNTAGESDGSMLVGYGGELRTVTLDIDFVQHAVGMAVSDAVDIDFPPTNSDKLHITSPGRRSVIMPMSGE